MAITSLGRDTGAEGLFQGEAADAADANRLTRALASVESGKLNVEEVGEPQVCTAAEVARWHRIPRSTLHKLCLEGQIPATKIGRHWRYDRATMEGWLRTTMRVSGGNA